MGAYRELVYGICFFVLALTGAFTLGPFIMPLLFEPTKDFDRFRVQAFACMAIGACAGGGMWLGIKARFLAPRRK